ncbi:hypothetical protein WN51_14688 [Melipona quadrifasciata]|uniref:Uncharacterized protein n=1 Tax=Melipona quadrifasciata TaxID=166423 RepID=A0A0M9A0C6_9HYME|nr:hypothetical protein WN51_14688 [Melipona quadrifasciata]
MDITINKNLQMLLNPPSTYENFRCAMDEIKILKEFDTRKQNHNDESGTMAIEHERKNERRRNNHGNSMNTKKVINKMFPLRQAKSFECYV